MAKTPPKSQQEIEAEIAELEKFTEDEIEHYVTVSCMRQREAEESLAAFKEQYGDLIKTEKSTRERLLSHLKSRQDADKIVANAVAPAV